ncbi:MAG: mechanosensitive ion channel [Candidatus Eisenbacteria bacterium]|nr:mechanosensitive ion channel [Candidatus Eisenbacteria bacterium]
MKLIISHGVKIVFILIIALVSIRILLLLIRRMEKAVQRDDTVGAEQIKRAKTLSQVLRTATLISVLTIAGVMVIKELGIDIGPILAGAGILGLAIGLGAQTLVKDIIGGILILGENQFRVGDVVRVGGVSGVVENMSLRTTILRDLEGAVHVIPNSEVKVVSNLTKGWSQAVVNVNIAYGEDIDKVMRILDEVGEELSLDETFSSLILEKPQVLGINEFGESHISIMMLVKTAPMKQWQAARELRRRIRKTFDAKGIAIPFPHRIVISKSAGNERGA